MVGEFEAKGGQTVKLHEDNLRTFVALSKLLAENPKGIAGWLRAVKPASATSLLSAIAPLQHPPQPTDQTPSPVAEGTRANSTTSDPRPAAPDYTSAADEIPIGRSEETGKALTVKLEDLRRHVALFAGSGSGKTVLIRRLMEECALKGVSSIVLDPNNDLARLGPTYPAAGSRAMRSGPPNITTP
ncbi:MAG: DUF87 domain-containing protein [Pseudomonadota bacterium]